MTHNKTVADCVNQAIVTVLSQSHPNKPFLPQDYGLIGGQIAGLKSRGFIKRVGEIKKPDNSRKRSRVYQFTRDGLKHARKLGFEFSSDDFSQIRAIPEVYFSNEYAMQEV
jgi:hypothetical protein